MGGKSSGPDYGDLSMQQGENNAKVNRDQTYANRPDQYTPWGYTDWTNQSVIDPSTGEATTEWTQTQGLTQELQDILNKQIAIQGGRSDVAGMMTGRLGADYAQGADFNNLSPMGFNPTAQYTVPEGSVGDPNVFRQRGSDASYNSAMNRVTPQFDEQRRAAESKMRNQGLGPEDAAWKSQMEGIGNNENDARNQAIWGAEGAGRQESALNYAQQMGNNQNQFQQALGANNQNFGQAMQGSNYANQLRQQQMTEMMQQRGFNLNEINAVMSGQQVNAPNMPTFNTAAAAAPAPLAEGAVAQANADQAASPWAGIGDIAGQAIGGYTGAGGTFGLGGG
jgi:hypothetical protein